MVYHESTTSSCSNPSVDSMAQEAPTAVTAEEIVSKLMETFRPVMVREVEAMLQAIYTGIYATARQDLIRQLNSPMPGPTVAPRVGANAIAPRDRDANGRAPKGTSDAVAKRLLGAAPHGLTWNELEVQNDKQPEGVSFSALKKTVYRMIDNNEVIRHGNRMALV